MSAHLRVIGFGRKDPAIHRVIDATRNNVHSPDLPEAPAPVRLVLENKTARSALLRGLVATTAIGGGLIAGQHLKRPKTGAVLGGLAAGAILNH